MSTEKRRSLAHLDRRPVAEELKVLVGAGRDDELGRNARLAAAQKHLRVHGAQRRQRKQRGAHFAGLGGCLRREETGGATGAREIHGWRGARAHRGGSLARAPRTHAVEHHVRHALGLKQRAQRVRVGLVPHVG